jgi:hypothetical protein
MNYQMSQCTMNYHRRPATEALEHLARTRCDRETPPRATAALSTSSSLKFGFTTLFDTAVSMQQQDSTEFPVISWSSDDERENSDDQDIIYPKATSSSNISSTMNYQMSQCTMNYHRRPATEALEHHLARTRCDRETPPRATAALSTSSSLKFGFTTLFDTAVSMQQQDSIEFPGISWSSDDERENSDDQDIIYPKATSSSKEREGLGYICKLATKKGASKKAQMVRSKALHSELSLLASSISPSWSSYTQRHGVVAKIA